MIPCKQLISKEINNTEHEYINIAPFPIIVLATPELTAYSLL
jgi:hypothetical protein